MTRHAFGLVGYAGSVLVSFALVSLLGTPPSARNDAGRSYAGPAFWEACGPSGQEVEAYTASDGSRLFFVRRELGTAAGARAALDALVGYEATPVAARSRRAPADCGARTYLIFATNQVPRASSDYAVVWVRGARLEAIYGPSIAHVMELEAANPAGRW
jgi:hypothetical protein